MSLLSVKDSSKYRIQCGHYSLNFGKVLDSNKRIVEIGIGAGASVVAMPISSLKNIVDYAIDCPSMRNFLFARMISTSLITLAVTMAPTQGCLGNNFKYKHYVTGINMAFLSYAFMSFLKPAIESENLNFDDVMVASFTTLSIMCEVIFSCCLLVLIRERLDKPQKPSCFYECYLEQIGDLFKAATIVCLSSIVFLNYLIYIFNGFDCVEEGN